MNLERTAKRGRTLLWAMVGFMACESILFRYAMPADIAMQLTTLMTGDYAQQAIRFGREIPITEAAHRVFGALMLALGMLQFDADLRRRRPAGHRAIGTAFITLAMILSVTALIIGLLQPFAGGPETVLTVVLVGSFLLMLLTAVAQVRRRRFAAHREWMIRAYGFSLQVVVQRFLFPPMVLLGMPGSGAFMTSTILAALIALATAEWWLRATRMPALAVPAGSPA